MLSTDRLCLGCMNDNGGETVCAICGYDSSSRNPENCLPVRFWLNDRYLVGKATALSNESISYIGWDNGEDTIITIREYFPLGAALRNPDKTVAITKGEEYEFNEGLMAFLDINRTLYRHPLPSMLKVLSVFEENGTVYAIFAHAAGITLEDFLVRNGGTLKWEQARPLFMPLIDTLKDLHSRGLFHRGISPATILVGRDGKLRLTDMAVKSVRMSGGTLETELFTGYAAFEQYENESLSDGAHTDIYGICATLFRVLIGAVPPDAPSRRRNDSLTIPAKFAEELPRHVLVALANGLQVLPKDRTKDVETLRNELVYGETAAAAPQKDEADNDTEIKSSSKKKKKGRSAKYAAISMLCTVLVFLVVGGTLAMTVFREQLFGKPVETDPDEALTSSQPEVPSIGSVDSGAAESATLYNVPDFSGKYYAEVIENADYEKFKFSVKGKEYSSYARGQICGQTVAAGSNVEKDTEILFTISLGAMEIKVANVAGLEVNAAKIELLKQGFLYENIEVIERYDPAMSPGVIIDQDPKYGTGVSTETRVKIYLNSYTGDEDGDEED